MESRLTAGLIVFLLIIVLCTGSSDNDRDLTFCGTWHHAKDILNLNVSLSPGCEKLSISAGKSTLSVKGKITAHCKRSDLIPLNSFGLGSDEKTKFCLYWEPLLDQLKLQVGEKNLTLCWPSSLHGSCCTDLSYGANEPEAIYGIASGMIKTDVITSKTYTGYIFNGQSIECKALCDQASNINANMTVQYPCARSAEVEMKADFRGYNIKSPVTKGVSAEPTAIVHLPHALKQAAKKTSKVVVTFFSNNFLFQDGHKEVRILNNVVGITVENEIITGLSERIRIDFHHDAISKMHSRKCVSWDTRKDPLLVNWLVDGCETKQIGLNRTECLCNHLTYFTVLVQLQPQPVRHLLALSVITSLGCAVSVISCLALIILLCRKRRSKEDSIHIHLGLAISLALLNLLFFLTGVLANVGGQSVCTWVGAALHYSLLSSFAWMGIQVFHTFWLVYIVFRPSPKHYVWNLVGFGLPAVPVIILVVVGDIYGVRKVAQSTNDSSPYLMCWMTDTYRALLAHYFTNMIILIMLVFSGIVMLFLVYREIRTRDEWRNNRVAFLSIWGLSCLFGTTWGLTFLNFGPFSDCVLFLSCILNSLQGFLLMLRYCMLNWMRKQAKGSALGSTSTGSTRQHMLQAEKLVEKSKP